jgi:hypothetical protein
MIAAVLPPESRDLNGACEAWHGFRRGNRHDTAPELGLAICEAAEHQRSMPPPIETTRLSSLTASFKDEIPEGRIASTNEGRCGHPTPVAENSAPRRVIAGINMLLI